MVRVTVVDDEVDFLELVRDVLEAESHEITTLDASDVDLVEQIVASDPDVVMLDIRLIAQSLRGWEVASRLRERPGMERLPILISSADLQAVDELQARTGDDATVEILPKPFGIDELMRRVERLAGAGRR